MECYHVTTLPSLGDVEILRIDYSNLCNVALPIPILLNLIPRRCFDVFENDDLGLIDFGIVEHSCHCVLGLAVLAIGFAEGVQH